MSNSKEFLENPEHKRYTIFPIKDETMWNRYETQQDTFWVANEINKELAKDPAMWATLGTKEERPRIQRAIKYVLAFFAVSDGVVNETLVEEITSRVQIREVRFWYDFQIMMENIHNIVYSKLIETYFPNQKERTEVFNAVESFPVIKRKIDWIHRWIGRRNDVHHLDSDSLQALKHLRQVYESTKRTMALMNGGHDVQTKEDTLVEDLFQKLDEQRPSLALVILINLITEQIFFSSSFAFIFWIKDIHKSLPGLCKANEFISRDEGMHADTGIFLLRYRISNKLPEHLVHQITREAVDIEMEFIQEVLPEGVKGMNAELMHEYVCFVADFMLQSLGYRQIYHKKCPFSFMLEQSVSVRMTDFFMDAAVSEYGHGTSGDVDEDRLTFEDD